MRLWDLWIKFLSPLDIFMMVIRFLKLECTVPGYSVLGFGISISTGFIDR